MYLKAGERAGRGREQGCWVQEVAQKGRREMQ